MRTQVFYLYVFKTYSKINLQFFFIFWSQTFFKLILKEVLLFLIIWKTRQVKLQLGLAPSIYFIWNGSYNICSYHVPFNIVSDDCIYFQVSEHLLSDLREGTDHLEAVIFRERCISWSNRNYHLQAWNMGNC